MGTQSTNHSVYNAGVRIPPPLIYIAMFAAGLLLQHLFPVDPLPSTITPLLPLLCFIISAILAFWSFAWFRHKRTSLLPTTPSTALITTGPYRFTRNPLYVSLVLLYAGIALLMHVIWALLLLPVVIIAVRYYVIAGEERYLEQVFGDEYLIYKTQVRRWI